MDGRVGGGEGLRECGFGGCGRVMRGDGVCHGGCGWWSVWCVWDLLSGFE